MTAKKSIYSKYNQHDLSEIHDDIDELAKLLGDRVGDLHNVKGAMQARHTYIFYRKLLWEIQHKLQNTLIQTK